MGLLGSLHCAGMCGPLAMIFGQHQKDHLWLSAVMYNLGRILTYSIIGAIFGIIGGIAVVAGMQRLLSIVMGIIFILIYFLSIDIDQQVSKTQWGLKYRQLISRSFNKLLSKKYDYSPFLIGSMNGLLPCGMVYLALAAALSIGSVGSCMLFMLIFGLGTVPMMLLFSIGSQRLPLKYRMLFRKIMPIFTLIFGLFLIYRGIAIYLPSELNFLELLNDPAMCH